MLLYLPIRTHTACVLYALNVIEYIILYWYFASFSGLLIFLSFESNHIFVFFFSVKWRCQDRLYNYEYSILLFTILMLWVSSVSPILFRFFFILENFFSRKLSRCLGLNLLNYTEVTIIIFFGTELCKCNGRTFHRPFG